MQVTPHCAKCGAEPSGGARYCPQCGAEILPAASSRWPRAAQYFADLRKRADGDQKEFREALLRLITDPYSTRERANYLLGGDAVSMVPPEHQCHEFMAGALGFFTFAFEAEKWAEGERRDTATSLCGNHVLKFVKDEYQIDDPRIHRARNLVLHRVGTTSFILIIAGEKLVLKLVKPRFWCSETITTETKKCRELFPDALQFEPRHAEILDSGERWVLMKFIPGRTLQEVLDSDKCKSQKPKDRLEAVSGLADKLFRVLKGYADISLHHLDLSPDNVILESEPGNEKNYKLYLIDFGRNYVITSTIARTKPARRALECSAPELERHDVRDSGGDDREPDPELADAYSVGVILAEALSGIPLGESHSKVDLVDHVSQTYPEIGIVLEEALEEKEESRLRQRNGGRPLCYLEERLKTAMALTQQVQFRDSRRWIDYLFVLLDVVFAGPGLGIMEKVFRELHFQLKRAASREGWSGSLLAFVLSKLRLFKRSGASRQGWSASLPVFAITAQLLHLVNYVAFVKVFYNVWWLGSPSPTPDIVIGPVVGLACSAVAAKYYVNIFSPVGPPALGKWTLLCMRANSMAFFAPAFYIIVFDPTAWPIAVALGMVPTILNNWLTFRFCRTAMKEIRIISGMKTSKDIEAFVRRFSTWAPLVLVVATFHLLVGVLNKLGVVDALWLWAIASIVVGLFMYTGACGRDAAMIRNGIRRLAYRLDALTPTGAGKATR